VTNVFSSTKKMKVLKKFLLISLSVWWYKKTYYYLTFKSVFMLKKKNSSCSTDFGFIPESFFLKSFKDRFGKSGVKIKETNNYYFSLLLCFNEFNKKFSFSSKIIGVINIWKILYINIQLIEKAKTTIINTHECYHKAPLPTSPSHEKNWNHKIFKFKHRKKFQLRFSEVQLCFVHVASEHFERNDISSK